ncbi:hypothetical protein [Photobacterium iliopiscarium]|uniref:hypothetical protein n=1 Tax=Photobacterium iliopiscarium TaxID=56192 RepID=UPI001E53408E|nr:hypothetical protein [Photobacterium iliopiscarium]MCD9486275.1 hypothetical protein [Photobacterium iliopiscarium]MCF2242839.1 hypothetical protein [Photobacterium iliopiscarium]
MSIEAMLATLKANQYIQSANVNSSHKLQLIYDFRYIEFQQILTIIRTAGVNYKNGFFQRLKYQLYSDADLQARDNLKITPFCCDKVAIRRENL